MKLTNLKSQITSSQLNQAIAGKPNPYNKAQTMREGSLWTDGEETVCDQLTVYMEDGEMETYYGLDVISLLKGIGLTFVRDNGRDVSHLWD